MKSVRIKLTDDLYQHVVAAVTEQTGNMVGPKQINMIESRLSIRANELNLENEKEYLDYFLKNKSSELKYLVSVLTVHHSFFFREFSHFEFLAKTVLPNLLIQMKAENRNKIRIWSAASSRGQEAYSLYMFIDN